MVLYSAKNLTARSQARELLALAAGETWGLSPLPRIARQEGGKPFFPEQEGRHFNLSHSGGLALCALDDAPVGVDIQIVEQWRPALPRRVCSQEEMAWLESQPQLWPAFTQLWCLKEARVKESGQGLRGLLRSIRVPFPEEGAVSLDGLWFRSYQGDGWAAAVCGHCKPPKNVEKVLDISTV